MFPDPLFKEQWYLVSPIKLSSKCFNIKKYVIDNIRCISDLSNYFNSCSPFRIRFSMILNSLKLRIGYYLEYYRQSL